jgi:hypothetical protein
MNKETVKWIFITSLGFTLSMCVLWFLNNKMDRELKNADKRASEIIDSVLSVEDKYDAKIDQEVEEFKMIDSSVIVSTKVESYKNGKLHTFELMLSNKCKNNDSLIKVMKDSQYQQALPTYIQLKEILKVKGK